MTDRIHCRHALSRPSADVRVACRGRRDHSQSFRAQTTYPIRRVSLTAAEPSSPDEDWLLALRLAQSGKLAPIGHSPDRPERSMIVPHASDESQRSDGILRQGCRMRAVGGRMDVQADQLLTPAEVAKLFRVDPKTVTRWAKAGKLSSIRTLGGHRRYRKQEITSALEGGITSTSEVRR
jgi:excisionase family DNA binding protein